MPPIFWSVLAITVVSLGLSVYFELTKPPAPEAPKVEMPTGTDEQPAPAM
jgi:hypothetical protein